MWRPWGQQNRGGRWVSPGPQAHSALRAPVQPVPRTMPPPPPPLRTAAASSEGPAVTSPPARAAVLPPRPIGVPPDAYWDPVQRAWFTRHRCQ
eukprot:121840-Alexandrium_andersonii.AAC.2